MKRILGSRGLLGVGLFLTAVLLVARTGWAQTAASEHYLHVKVDSHEGETVRVNLPLSLAEKVLPAINHEQLHEGKVRIGHCHLNDIDVRALLEAVRTAPDNEFVTVRDAHSNVRVSKSGGLLLIDIQDKSEGKAPGSTVKVKVPMSVVQAMLSSGNDELDLVAGIRALRQLGDTLLVSVQDGEDTVRVWVDSNNRAE
jgi:hypothetical protein